MQMFPLVAIKYKKGRLLWLINSQTLTLLSLKNQQTLDSSTNFCAAMVMNRKSAW
jgi:hypothetical protein